MYLGAVIVILLVLGFQWTVVYTQVQSYSCPENCVNRTCTDPLKGLLSCSFGCANQSYFGPRCSYPCPNPCLYCSKDVNQNLECYRCIDGFSLVNKICTLSECPPGCDTCMSTTNCIACKRGHFKAPSSSVCTPCPQSCAACSSATNCSECKPGFTGSTCQHCVDGFYGVDCNTHCPFRCNKCSSSGICSVLKVVHVGYSLSFSCPHKCKFCSSPTHCTACTEGFYNTARSCSDKCPPRCSSCTSAKSCTACERNFKGELCLACVHGFYGKDCDKRCPVKCGHNQCSQSTGACHTDCSQGFYGTECSKDCSPNCYNKKCSPINGRCSPCKEGFYGDTCSKECSPNCTDSICIQNSGNCFHGCKQGFSGDKCCLQNKFCHQCSSNDVCSVCLVGKYGMTCEENCSSNCDKRGCEKDTGKCYGCKGHYFGSLCSIACPKGCKESPIVGSICYKDTGNCTGDCVEGFIGKTCADAETKSNTLTILVTLLGIALILGLLGLVLIRYKRRYI